MSTNISKGGVRRFPDGGIIGIPAGVTIVAGAMNSGKSSLSDMGNFRPAEVSSIEQAKALASDMSHLSFQALKRYAARMTLSFLDEEAWERMISGIDSIPGIDEPKEIKAIVEEYFSTGGDSLTPQARLSKAIALFAASPEWTEELFVYLNSCYIRTEINSVYTESPDRFVDDADIRAFMSPTGTEWYLVNRDRQMMVANAKEQIAPYLLLISLLGVTYVKSGTPSFFKLKGLSDTLVKGGLSALYIDSIGLLNMWATQLGGHIVIELRDDFSDEDNKMAGGPRIFIRLDRMQLKYLRIKSSAFDDFGPKTHERELTSQLTLALRHIQQSRDGDDFSSEGTYGSSLPAQPSVAQDGGSLGTDELDEVRNKFSTPMYDQ